MSLYYKHYKHKENGRVSTAESIARTDGSDPVTASEVSSDEIKVSNDNDSAVKAVAAGASVDIPKDVSDGGANAMRATEDGGVRMFTYRDYA